MALIGVVSPKGGVGKTTCVASLAYGIRRLGYRVVVVDFDPQNALRLHFGLSLEDGRGYVQNAVNNTDWRPLALTADKNILLLPYGYPDRAHRESFDHHLDEEAFLPPRLKSLSEAPGTVVIADLPPGESPALRAVARLANLRITVLLADSASLSLLPRVEDGHFYPDNVPLGSAHGFVLNQVDPRRRLSNQIREFMEQRHGETLLGVIHRDEALPEANARQCSVFDGAPGSQAARDLNAFVRRTLRELGKMDDTAVDLIGQRHGR